MKRSNFLSNDLNLSYLDSGSNAPAIIALHAHWMEASTFTHLAKELTPQYRVISLDQRGHGYSDHANSYSRNDYIQDIKNLIDHLNLPTPLIIIGNSLGGINAYQFAAKFPNLVKAFIIEDIGVEIPFDINFTLQWKGTFKTKQDLIQCVGERFASFLEPSFRQTNDGWTLAFNPDHMLQSQNNAIGEHWSDWLASTCPALLIRGEDSRVTTDSHLKDMAEKRPNTTFLTLPGGHVTHLDHPNTFASSMKKFLQTIQ